MTGKYILIVDDDPDLVETVSMMLESKGFEVGKAYDGIEGEEAILPGRYDAQEEWLRAVQGIEIQ